MLAKQMKPKKNCNIEQRWTGCCKNIRSIKHWCKPRTFTIKPGEQKDYDERHKLFEPSTEAMKIQLKKVLKESKETTKAFEELHVTLLRRSPTNNTIMMEMMRVRFFLTQRNDKILIKFFILRMKKRMEQIQNQLPKFFLVSFYTCWSRKWGLFCSWRWTM